MDGGIVSFFAGPDGNGVNTHLEFHSCESPKTVFNSISCIGKE